MAFYNAPRLPHEPPHSNPLRPWVLPVFAALVVLGIIAWNVDSSGRLPITNMPNATTGIAPVSK